MTMPTEPPNVGPPGCTCPHRPVLNGQHDSTCPLTPLATITQLRALPTPPPPPPNPTAAAAWLAQELAAGGVDGVHITLFRHNGTMSRQIFGIVQLMALVWAAQYMTRDALATADAVMPPTTK